jgi:hypothetical protein
MKQQSAKQQLKPQATTGPQPDDPVIEVTKEAALAAWDNDGAFLKEPQRRDPSHRYRWIKISGPNWQKKRRKGWKPVVGEAELERLGVEHLINPYKKAQFMDCELWRMPESWARDVEKKLNAKTEKRRNAVRESLEGQMADIRGRSGGKVDPFMIKSGDVLDKGAMSASKKE